MIPTVVFSNSAHSALGPILLPIAYFIQLLKASFGITVLLRHGVTRLTRSPLSSPPLLAGNQYTVFVNDYGTTLAT